MWDVTPWVRFGLINTFVLGLVMLIVEPWIGGAIITLAILGWQYWESRQRE